MGPCAPATLLEAPPSPLADRAAACPTEALPRPCNAAFWFGNLLRRFADRRSGTPSRFPRHLAHPTVQFDALRFCRTGAADRFLVHGQTNGPADASKNLEISLLDRSTALVD